MAKRASRKRVAAPSADSAPAEVAKVQYPKALYSKTDDGALVSTRVEHAEEHADLLKREPKAKWSESPADHGVETAPAAGSSNVVNTH